MKQKNEEVEELVEDEIREMYEITNGLYAQLYNERKILINQPVNDNLIENVVMPIMLWNEEDEDIPIEEITPIRIYINSNGGHIQPALATISAILNSKTPVYTYVIGRAYSSALYIFLAGHYRHLIGYGSILVHEGEIAFNDSLSKTLDSVEFIKKQNKLIKDFICKQTLITPRLYNKKFRREWYFNAEEALKYGLAHEIIGENNA